jgi:hypothetical protein
VYQWRRVIWQNYYFRLAPFIFNIYFTLKIEAVRSSETCVIWVHGNTSQKPVLFLRYVHCISMKTVFVIVQPGNEGVYQVTHRENYGFRNSGASAIKTWGSHETLMIAPPLSQTSSFSNAPELGAWPIQPLSCLHSYVPHWGGGSWWCEGNYITYPPPVPTLNLSQPTYPLEQSVFTPTRRIPTPSVQPPS